MSTKERLAQRLHDIGLFDLSERARIGEFSDFESPHAMPKRELVDILRQANLGQRCKVVIDEIIAGKWDDTKEEAEAWFQKEGKNLL